MAFQFMGWLARDRRLAEGMLCRDLPREPSPTAELKAVNNLHVLISSSSKVVCKVKTSQSPSSSKHVRRRQSESPDRHEAASKPPAPELSTRLGRDPPCGPLNYLRCFFCFFSLADGSCSFNICCSTFWCARHGFPTPRIRSRD